LAFSSLNIEERWISVSMQRGNNMREKY
jgi:hypothetical protein